MTSEELNVKLIQQSCEALLASCEVLLAAIRERDAEIARCHARLEIDHVTCEGARQEVPMADRQRLVDGVDARDETIIAKDKRIAELKAANTSLVAAIHDRDKRIAELEGIIHRNCDPFDMPDADSRIAIDIAAALEKKP